MNQTSSLEPKSPSYIHRKEIDGSWKQNHPNLPSNENKSETCPVNTMVDSSKSKTRASRLTKSLAFFDQAKAEPPKKLPCEIVTPNDSNDPSYTNLDLPYRVICRQRYKRAGILQRKQFIKEIKKQEMSQSKALNGVRIHREFIDPVLVPPKPQEIIRLSPKQQFKLDELLNS